MYKSSLLTLSTIFLLVMVVFQSGCVTTPPAPTPPPVIDDHKPVVDSTVSKTPGTSTTPTTGCNCGATYTVKPKETLYGIATQCCLDPKDLVRWNKLSSADQIRPGQVLKLSGPAADEVLPSTSTPLPDSTDRKTVAAEDKAIYHTVVAKDTLYSIAKRYKRTIEEIKRWNKLLSNSLSVGQRLRVSPPTGDSTSEVTSPPVTAMSDTETPKTVVSPATATKSSGRHVVNSEDTLYSIAKLYGYTEADIAAWNDLQPPYTLAGGQILVVSPPAVVSPSKKKGVAEESSASSATPTEPAVTDSSPSRQTTKAAVAETTGETAGYHTVVPGDTLFNVSSRYGCTVGELKQWNKLTGNALTVGQQLRVSAAAEDDKSAVVTTSDESDKSTASFSPPSTNYIKYKVRQGETLYRVATQHGMTEKELAHLNGIGPPYTVYPGQELTVLPKNK